MEKFAEAIISIRPNFVEAILSGQKTIELRRRIPPVGIGTRLWLYATMPTAAVLGSAVIENIFRGAPESIWSKTSDRTGIDRAAFDTYFSGSDEAIGLELVDVKRGTPVSIGELRNIRSGFHPPQVIARLSAAEAAFLQKLATPIGKHRVARTRSNGFK